MVITEIVFIGIVMNAGTPCPQVRAEDGRVVQATGLSSTINSGDHVRITGKMRYSFSCQAEVLAVLSAEKMAQ